MTMQIMMPKAKNGMMDAGWPARGLIALGFVMLMFCVLLSWQSSAQEELAGASITVDVPRDAKGASFVALDLALRASPKSEGGNLGGVVRLKRSRDRAVEIGRFSLVAASGEEQRYQFNITSAIRRLDLAGSHVDVEVVLVDRTSGKAPAAGASLSITTAQIAVR